MSESSESCHVSVDSKELANAWKTLRRTTSSKHRGELLVSHSDGELVFDLGGAAIGVEADGTWSGQARLDSAHVFRLLLHLPKQGTLAVFREGDRIRFGTIAFPCSWDTQPSTGLSLPMNPTGTEILWVSYVWSRPDMESAGLLPLVEKAERDRDARIGRAVETLAPLGVSEEDLAELVKRCISARHG
jgi:hypothetical protein